MNVTRIYKNSADETLRIDSIIMIRTAAPPNVYPETMTYRRSLQTNLVFTGIDRTVASIELLGDYDSSDFNPSIANSYSWVAWSTFGENGVRCNMSDLPQVGESV